MKKKIYYLCMLCGTFCFGQEGFVGGATSASSSTYTFTTAVGQVFSATNAQASLQSGILHNFNLTILGTSEYEDVQLMVYPNPTSQWLYLRADEKKLKHGSYKLYNAQGQLITESKITDNETVINMANYPTGMYLLTVSSDSTEPKTFKILKK